MYDYPMGTVLDQLEIKQHIIDILPIDSNTIEDIYI